MYFPYFRGKQFELITVREKADLIAQAGFVPIIEPVRRPLGSLSRALEAVSIASGRAVVVINPQHGDHTQDSEAIKALLSDEFGSTESISPGVVLSHQSGTVEQVAALCTAHAGQDLTLIHAGYDRVRDLAEVLRASGTRIDRHVFIEGYCGRLYRRHFTEGQRVLVRDGFQRRLNREHPPVEVFSDLHVTYREEGMDGFGDFLMVGGEFSETGGPAYAVAIHLTFIDPDEDDQMFIHHFVSDRTATPDDPAGKFSEALKKLVHEVEHSDTHVTHTKAVEEFVDLYGRGHFPGLGYVKKLSMKHHIETLAEYFANGA